MRVYSGPRGGRSSLAVVYECRKVKGPYMSDLPVMGANEQPTENGPASPAAAATPAPAAPAPVKRTPAVLPAGFARQELLAASLALYRKDRDESAFRSSAEA